MNPRTLLATTTVALSLGLVLSSAPTYAGSSHTKTTTFAFKGSGYGTRAVGGQAPTRSDPTAFQAIGCTNKAGAEKSNDVAESAVPGLGTISHSTTRVWTTSRKGVTASHSTHSISKIVLAETGVGELAIHGIKSTSTASHDSSGFHAVTSTQVGTLAFTPPVGPAQSFPAPTPDQPVTIPGLATVYAGKSTTSHSRHDAKADAYALRIDSLASSSSIRVAHSRAQLNSGVTGGVFSGNSVATHVVSAAAGMVKGGRNPLTLMPCQGTYGQVRQKEISSLDLGQQLLASNVSTREMGIQGAHRARGYERAHVGRVSFGGALLIKDIIAKATVVRTAHGVVKSAKGTRLGSVTANGQTRTFPKTGVLEIPGVAKLERAVVTRSHQGLSVIGLRVTLLDGSGAVINFAEAKLRIRPAGG